MRFRYGIAHLVFGNYNDCLTIELFEILMAGCWGRQDECTIESIEGSYVQFFD